jgi:hypothetical protein
MEILSPAVFRFTVTIDTPPQIAAKEQWRCIWGCVGR